ncbi:MAG: MAPEG family protein [Maricaulaceae bacterium]|nr:MAPEG family protein [Maricaulaceae bacterium]
MTAMQAVALYAGLNIILLVFLAFRTTSLRRATKVDIGDGGNPALARAHRAHANAAENIPAGLIALFLVGLLGAQALYVHALGAMLTLGRAAHAYGFTTKAGVSVGRFMGMLLTWLMFLAAAVLLILHAIEAGPF